MKILSGAAHAVAETTYLTTVAVGGVGGAAIGGVLGAVKGLVHGADTGLRNGLGVAMLSAHKVRTATSHSGSRPATDTAPPAAAHPDTPGREATATSPSSGNA